MVRLCKNYSWCGYPVYDGCTKAPDLIPYIAHFFMNRMRKGKVMIRKLYRLTILGLLILGLCSCHIASITPQKDIPEISGQANREEILSQNTIPLFTYKIIKTYPHDVTSYTEGLQILDGYLYEGTGRYGQSRLLKTELKTGKALQQHELGPRYFGEGITVFQNNIYQLTYKSNVGFIYDKDSFEAKKRFHYLTQGWGITNDGTQLIMSDGSAALIFLNPETLEVKKYIIVSDDKSEVGFLNELEYANGEIYANVWQTDFIARISPETGKITGWIDLTGINPDPEKLKYPYVLNGIAYDEKSGHLIIAGKCWPELYEIELVPRINKE
jgi:glutaminyl-peptide cyclotransferase